MRLPSKGEIQDQDGNTWHVIHKSPYYVNGLRMHGFYRLKFRKNIDDILWKEGIFGQWECEEIIAGKGRIQVRGEG